MRLSGLATSVLVVSALLIATPSDASPVSFHFTAVFTDIFDPDGYAALNGITLGTTAWGNATWDTDAPMFSSDYGTYTHGGGTVQELEIHAGLIYIDSPTVETVSIGVNGDRGFFGIGSEGGFLQGRYYAYPGPREAWISLNAVDPSLVPVGPEALFDFDPTIWSGGQLAFYGSIGPQPPNFRAFATITSVTVPTPPTWLILAVGLAGCARTTRSHIQLSKTRRRTAE